MRILHVLYYYEPYTSGLTVYAARLANAFAARGHEVSVLASRHDRDLPRRETYDGGVHIRRLPVATTFDRAVIMPTLIPSVIAQMRHVNVVHLHLPMAETALLVGIGRAMGKRVVVTQHADLVLQGSRPSRLAANVARWSAIAGAQMANAVVANTSTRAKVSPVTRGLGDSLHIIPPPIMVDPAGEDAGQAFRRDFAIGDGPLVGYVGRYASEKGIEVLLQAIPAIRERFPEVTVALAGPRTDARTGEPLRGPWDRWLDAYAANIRQLDYLSDADLARFYAACDVLVLPSTDWTESFGMVQIEAMLRGTPVVASDLPGVNDPVRKTGFGLLAEPGDVTSLADAITNVLGAPDQFQPDVEVVNRHYSLESTVAAYERVYRGEPS